MKMTAAIVSEEGGAFTLEEVDLADPRDDEILVKIVASGVCHTDMTVRDAYYPTPLRPCWATRARAWLSGWVRTSRRSSPVTGLR